MDGLAEAHREWRYVVANRVPVRPHGNVKTPIAIVGCFLYFLEDWRDKVVDTVNPQLDAAVRQRKESINFSNSK
jgi:hypothetical protein